jgi:hypothetical protein
MRLPKGTSISLIELPSENQDPWLMGFDSRTERLLPLGCDRNASSTVCTRANPEGIQYRQSGVRRTNQDIHFSRVRADWEIERTHDPAFVVEDYNVWANKIAERIRESLQN